VPLSLDSAYSFEVESPYPRGTPRGGYYPSEIALGQQLASEQQIEDLEQELQMGPQLVQMFPAMQGVMEGNLDNMIEQQMGQNQGGSSSSSSVGSINEII
jgi:DNA topoisomerase VI subunit A